MQPRLLRGFALTFQARWTGLIALAVQKAVAYTAGGNLGNSAKDGDRLILDHNKILTNAGKYKIILKYGDVKNNVNN